jgi:uncharacterized protein (TIGR00369 family)
MTQKARRLMTAPLVSTAQLQALIDETRFTRMLGMRVESIGDGTCRISVPFNREFERPGGIVSGLVFITAADVAVWLAIKTRLGFEDMSVTADMSSSFLAPLAGGTLYADAQITKIGRRLINATARCECESGKLLAQHLVSYARQGTVE